MKDKPVVFLTMVMDHSGSMNKVKELALGNYNEQINSSKKKSNNVNTLTTLIEFDDEINIIYDNKNIEDVDILDDYWVGGMTSLHDAIARGIKVTEINMEKHKSTDKSALVVIMTDGGENSSVEYPREARQQIKQMIDDLSNPVEGNIKWSFIFMGADIEVEHMAVHGFGIDVGNTLKFKKSLDSYQKASNVTCDGLDAYYDDRMRGLASTKSFYSASDKTKEV